MGVDLIRIAERRRTTQIYDQTVDESTALGVVFVGRARRLSREYGVLLVQDPREQRSGVARGDGSATPAPP